MIKEDVAVGLIPARGGSKSIPMKNLVPLSGKPLISYVISAGLNAVSLSGIYCSTDHEEISNVCKGAGVNIIHRPEHLGQDDTPVIAVIRHVIDVLNERNGFMPGIIALLQPTSPFLSPAHIDDCIELLKKDKTADSAQTISPVIHNSHAFNQRVTQNGYVQFRFINERREAYNKQLKPKHYTFGNLVVSRTRSILEGKDCFGDISIPCEISRNHAFDLDTMEDVEYANYLIKQGKVELPKDLI